MADVGRRQDFNNRHDQTEVTLSDYQSPIRLGQRVAGSVSVSRQVYALKALLATAYKFSDRYAVLVDEDGPDRWVLFVVVPKGTDLADAIDAVVRDLGDQQLRVTLESEFGALRTLIVAQAFAEGNLLEVERDTTNHNTDPRGTGQRR